MKDSDLRTHLESLGLILTLDDKLDNPDGIHCFYIGAYGYFYVPGYHHGIWKFLEAVAEYGQLNPTENFLDSLLNMYTNNLKAGLVTWHVDRPIYRGTTLNGYLESEEYKISELLPIVKIIQRIKEKFPVLEGQKRIIFYLNDGTKLELSAKSGAIENFVRLCSDWQIDLKAFKTSGYYVLEGLAVFAQKPLSEIDPNYQEIVDSVRDAGMMKAIRMFLKFHVLFDPARSDFEEISFSTWLSTPFFW